MLEGKKTFIGLAITLLGVLGLLEFITPDEAERVVNLFVEIFGIAVAVYGRVVATKKIRGGELN